MRMWNVDPSIMCRKHLLGEHVELHMFVGTINKGNSLAGFKSKGLVEIHNIKSRHKELVNEMISRGYNHKSDLVDFEEKEYGVVDVDNSYNCLIERCDECRNNIGGELK